MYINTFGNHDYTSGNNARIRRCGNYWEYCDGNCNSCQKNIGIITTDHSILGNSYTYTSSGTLIQNK